MSNRLNDTSAAPAGGGGGGWQPPPAGAAGESDTTPPPPAGAAGELPLPRIVIYVSRTIILEQTSDVIKILTSCLMTHMY